MRIYPATSNPTFTCKQCGFLVHTHKAISGVINRNHCPYCLYSRHVDLFTAGDRLCACKGIMSPIGLSFKNKRDKFFREKQGELMLVHCCKMCGDISINRIAADDDPLKLLAVVDHSTPDFDHLQQICRAQGISLLKRYDRPVVKSILFGVSYAKIPDSLLVG